MIKNIQKIAQVLAGCKGITPGQYTLINNLLNDTLKDMQYWEALAVKTKTGHPTGLDLLLRLLQLLGITIEDVVEIETNRDEFEKYCELVKDSKEPQTKKTLIYGMTAVRKFFAVKHYYPGTITELREWYKNEYCENQK